MKRMQNACEKALGKEPRAVPPAIRRWGVGHWQLWIGVAFSLGFLVLALRDVRFTQLVSALRQIDLLLLLLAVGSYVITVVAKAARWQVLLGVRKSPSLGRAFSILSIGHLINAFAPARLGDLARAYLMGEAEADSKIYVLGTIAVEKVIDLLFLMLAIALLLSQMTLPEWLVGPARATALVIALLVPLFVLLAWQSEFVLQRMGNVSRLLPSGWGEWIVQQARLGLTSLGVVRQPHLVAGVLAWTVPIWILGTLTNYTVFLAMGLSLSIWAALFLLIVLQVGVAVPSSPGRIGVFHYLVVASLSIFAIEKEVALGYGGVLHVVVYVPMALLGTYCLWREKVTGHTLAEAAARLNRLSGKAG